MDAEEVVFPATQKEDCVRYIVLGLTRVGVPSEVAGGLVPVILHAREGEYDARTTSSSVRALVSRSRGWAIRATDFEAFRSFVGGASFTGVAAYAAAAGAGMPTALPLAVALAALLGAMYAVYFNAKHRGADLDPLQVAVLVALKNVNGGKGATPEEVAGYLSESFEVSPEAVMVELTALTSVTSANGSKVPFAFEDVRGRWRTDC